MVIEESFSKMLIFSRQAQKSAWLACTLRFS